MNTTKIMKKTGMIIHVAGSGRAIVRLTDKVSEGDILYNSRGSRMVRIREIIGPVNAPYASAEPITNNINRYVGKEVVSSRSARL